MSAASVLLALPATAQCPPVSTLPCDKLQVNLPYSLSFSAGVAGTIADKNGLGSGFTIVDTYSGTRDGGDGAPSNTSVPGYERSKLSVVSGRLQLVTNKGIASLTTNNQLNTLGVRVSTQNKLTLQVTLVNPYYGTNYEQAGLWLGLNDKTFLKIVVVGNRVELRREVNDASGTAPSNITPIISGLNTKTVRLRMVVDPSTNTAQGFYSTDGTNYTSVGGGVSTSGSGLTGSTAYAGVFGTHRNGPSPITYTFDDFSVTATTAPPPAPSGNGYLVVESADKFPKSDELTFSLIQIPWRRQNDDGTYTPYNRNHNKVKLKLTNKGAGTLSINALTLSNPAAWKIASLSGAATSLPARLAPGTSMEALIEFTARDLGGRVKILNNLLTISSNDAVTPSRVVKLNGMWQYKGEGGNEPYAQEVIKAFGYLSRTGFGATDGVNDGTAIVPNSDEIMSAFFVRADAAKPVTVVQMAAYHGCCAFTETFQWYNKGSFSNSTVFTHDALDGQSLLPLKINSTSLAQGTFNPAGAFGIKVSSSFSDRSRNFEKRIGMRFWKVIDANGNVVPNAYIMGGDYLGSSFTNYDYQDYLFYITNVRPETGTVHYSELASTPSALNLGSTGVGVAKTQSISLKNLGKTYANGSKDPSVLIKSVQIVGGAASAAFTASMPATTTLAAGGSTSVNVTFNPGSPGLKNAALLVHHNGANSPLRIPLYGIGNTAGSALTIAKRIKGGSDAAVTIGSNVWEADINYRKGLIKLDRPGAAPVAGTDIDALYQTYLSSTGDFNVISYEVPLANGTYQVRLHFAEMYWPAIGSRVFSIDIENSRRLTNFDIYREVGPRAALVKDYEVNVADGVLSLKFTPTADRLSLAGVEIFRNAAAGRLATAQAEGVEGLAKLSVYPNPTSGGKLHLALEGFGEDEKVDVTLYSLTGQAVQRTGVITDTEGAASVDVTLAPSLNRGLYLLKARGTAREAQTRVVIE
jgi:hypothetical protein